MSFVLVVSIVLATLTLLYLYLTRNFKYWQKRNIPCQDGALPGVGHLGQLFLLKSSFPDCCKKIYNDNKHRSMVGFYKFTTPALMIREPDLVKTVMQTDFSSFHMNGLTIDPELDPLLANNPFFTEGEKWMTGRKRMTYAFSSMRLKMLLETIKQICEKFEQFVNRRLDKTGKAELELKSLFAKYTAEVIAGVAFGVDGLCFDEKKKSESLYSIGKSFLKPTALNKFIITLLLFVPSLNKILRLRFIPKKIEQFFITMVAEIWEQRRKEEVAGNDFLQIMIDFERTEKEKVDLNVVTSHAVSFFIDGYDTSSTMLSFVAFQLSRHPKVQERLREEIASVLKKHNGVITYEALRDMVYMDQVFFESMRLFPVLGTLDKTCTKEFELKGSDGITCRLQPGTNIIIPVMSLHRDPRYWEEPNVFDPDRFSPDRKHSIEKFAFLPFGEGPRMCVGRRMAQLQIKACLAAFLSKFSLEFSPKTKLPIKLVPSFTIIPEGGLWAYIRPL